MHRFQLYQYRILDLTISFHFKQVTWLTQLLVMIHRFQFNHSRIWRCDFNYNMNRNKPEVPTWKLENLMQKVIVVYLVFLTAFAAEEINFNGTKVSSYDPILLDPITFWRMEYSLLLIKQHCIGFSWFAAHIHRKSADYKTSIRSELDPTKLDRVNRALNQTVHSSVIEFTGQIYSSQSTTERL